MAQTWEGSGRDLHDAAEDAAANALAAGTKGKIELVSIHVNVHENAPGETGPNPISSYTVVLGRGGH